MKQHKLLCFHDTDFHHMNYYTYGLPTNKTAIVCVHGLTRNGQDFHYLAEELANDYFVVSVDLIGRGESDRLPAQYYSTQQYLRDLSTLLATLADKTIYYIGTSLGGLLGQILASLENSPIKKLILNDIGPIVSPEALKKLQDILNVEATFPTFEALKEYFKSIYSSWGPLSDEQITHLVKYDHQINAEGLYQRSFDHQIFAGFAKPQSEEKMDYDMLKVMGNIHCPILVLHGEQSEILDKNIIELMRKIQPSIKIVSYEDCGHAPSLMIHEHIHTIQEWLR